MIQRRLDKSSRGMWDFCHLYNMLIEATSYSSVRWLIEKSKRKTHVRWCFFKQVTRSRSHILLSWETEEVMIQFPSGLFLRRAMILIRGGSDYTSIAEQQSSVDLERDNMFKHCHELWCYQHGQFTLHKMRSVLLFSRPLSLSRLPLSAYYTGLWVMTHTLFCGPFPKIWFSVRVWTQI